MCYSVESSAKTTAISLIAIIYLFTSNIPHFKWLAVTLIGWSLMQFSELLLWLTEPRKGCTDMNTLITMTLIPFTLIMQPLGSLFGSLYVIPWDKSTTFRKNFIIAYSIFVTLMYTAYHFYKPEKICTTVTKGGHLDWYTKTKIPEYSIFTFIFIAILIVLPLFMFWDKSVLVLFLLILFPAFGFIYGKMYTDSAGSIWCYYTSYTSIISSALLFLDRWTFQMGTKQNSPSLRTALAVKWA